MRRTTAFLFVGLAIAIGIASASYLNLHNDNISGRLYLHALPTAISVLSHHHQLDYTALQEVANVFYAHGGHYPPDGIDAGIGRARTIAIGNRAALYYWSADDRGLRDFVIAGFTLFGPSINSLTLFFWLFFAMAALLSCLQQREPVATQLTCYVVAGCVLSLNFLVFVPADFREHIVAVPRMPAVNIYESRAFDLLAVMPAAAIYFGTIARSKPHVGFVVLNALVMALIIHVRSSAMWVAVLTVLLLLPVVLRNRRAIVSIVLICGAVGLLSLYQQAVFNKAYHSGQGNRTVWHNVLMGLEETPTAKKYRIILSDQTAVEGVIQWLKDRSDPRMEAEWVKRFLPNWFGYPGFNYNDYEAAARDMVFDIVRREPLQVIGVVLGRVRYIVGYLATATASLLGVIWPFYLAVFVLAAAVPANRDTAFTGAPFLIVLLVFGMAPAIVFYFAVSSIMGSIVAIHAIAILAIAWLVGPSMRRLLPARSGPAPG